MNVSSLPSDPASDSGSAPWTCPFCTLLCDDVGHVDTYNDGGAENSTDGDTNNSTLALTQSLCPRANAALAQFSATRTLATPLIDGQPANLDAALAAAATRLGQAVLPLFGGLATDVAGARALYALANQCGAVLDHAHGAAMLASMRSLQDRGTFSTSLAEVRNRADVLLCIGTQPSAKHPEFFRRCGLPTPGEADRTVIFLGTEIDPRARGHAGVDVQSTPLQGDLLQSLAVLNTLCRAQPPQHMDFASAALRALAARLRGAQYAALVITPSVVTETYGEHAALLLESISHLAKTLNRTTRAGVLSLGGDDGGNTVNYALTWLSGLPLRTAIQPRGLDHDPHRYDTARLLPDRAVDAVLWVSSFTSDLAPPDTDLPLVVLGHPALAATMRTRHGVFLPVSTPGIGSSGHLFRTDGGVVLPLTPARPDNLPTVAMLARQLLQRLTEASA